MGSKTSPASTSSTQNPSFNEALAVWARIGVLSFGGPAGQIALMHRVLVDERRWISEERFLHAHNFCMLLPGPEATQLATYVGWLLHGTLGGLAAGFPFVLPGALVVLVLSIAYALYGHVPLAAPGGESPARRFTYRGVLFGRDHVLTDISIFFSKLAVVTFGGAYSVLAYMAQAAVETHGWLSAGEMLDGLGLAETPPGPLILVTEFIGFLAGYRHGGEPELAFGLLGAAVTLWATFVPCFLWIFVGAPYIERLEASPRLANALSGVTTAVVGVILNLSLWFALQVFFAKVEPVGTWTVAGLVAPPRSTLKPWCSRCLRRLLRFKFSIGATLAISAGAALVWFMLAGAS